MIIMPSIIIVDAVATSQIDEMKHTNFWKNYFWICLDFVGFCSFNSTFAERATILFQCSYYLPETWISMRVTEIQSVSKQALKAHKRTD